MKLSIRKLIISSTLFILFIVIITIIVFFWHQVLNTGWQIDAGKFGNFGNFIGGILSIVSAFLLIFTYYFTLESSFINKIEEYYKSINSEIGDAFFDNKKGIDAYLRYDMKTDIKNVILDNLNLVITSFEIYLSLIESNKILRTETKRMYKIKFYLLFYSKVLWPLHGTIIKNGLTFINDNIHDDSKLILPKYAEISIRCINFLRDMGVAAASDFKDDNIKKLNEIIQTKQNNNV
jgi:hypothetical protein